MLGTFLCAVLFIVACFATEMTMRETAFFAAMSLAFGYGWFRLRNSN